MEPGCSAALPGVGSETRDQDAARRGLRMGAAHRKSGAAAAAGGISVPSASLLVSAGNIGGVFLVVGVCCLYRLSLMNPILFASWSWPDESAAVSRAAGLGIHSLVHSACCFTRALSTVDVPEHNGEMASILFASSNVQRPICLVSRMHSGVMIRIQRGVVYALRMRMRPGLPGQPHLGQCQFNVNVNVNCKRPSVRSDVNSPATVRVPVSMQRRPSPRSRV